MHYLRISCLLFLNCFIAWGQQPFIQNYPVEVYQGASQNWGFKQDTQGVIYVANSDGVLRSDGVKWNLISLPSKGPVYAIEIDSADKIYTTSSDDLGYFARGIRGNYEYQSLLLKLPDSIRQDLDIFQIKAFKDKIFFLARNHIYIYGNDGFEILNINANGIFVTNNELYILKGNRLLKYKNHGLEPDLYFGKMNPRKFRNYSVDGYLMLDDQNQVWYVDKKHKQCHLFSEELNRNLKNLPVDNMQTLANGNIIISIGTAVLFFNSNGKLLNRLEIDSPPYWGFLFEDRQHNLWINTGSNITQVITSSPLSFYDNKNGLEGVIVSLGKNGNHQYVGTPRGILYQEDQHNFTRLSQSEGITWNFFNFHSKLYASNEFGVLKLEGKKVTRIVEHPLVLALCELKQHPECMLMGTLDGLWLLQQKGHEWLKKKVHGFKTEIHFMQEDEGGNIWVSNMREGIWKIVLNETMDSVISTTSYSEANGLPSNSNNRIYRLGGQVVAATADGIYSYNASNNRFEPDEKYRKALGKGLCIYSLTENAEGDIYFWAALPQGKETAGTLKKQTDGSFRLLLTPFNKIASDFNNTRVDVDAPLLVTNSGEIWIGNNQKIISYNPYQKVFYNDSIQLSIQKVWASDSLIYRSASKDSVHTLPFAFNNFRFEFLCSFLEENKKIQYQYKMDGFEDKWSDWTLAREAFFTNLPEGDYTFYVRAKNIYNVVSEPVSFSFHINPPWYRTWLAYIVYVIAFVILVYIVVQLNLIRIKKQKKVLEEIVREKTKELVNANEELLTQSNLLAEQNHQLHDAKITIESQNVEIKNRNETLEEEVQKRTKELVEYNNQFDKFAFVTAHNLRGPVARILGLGIVLKMTTDPDEIKTITDKLAFTAQEIDSVIRDLNQILEIKNSSNQLEEINLKKKVNKVISNLEKEINDTCATIQIDLPENRLITTSRSYLDNIIYSLLSNSIKFRHPDRNPFIKITAIDTCGYLCLIITDNGLGIDLQKCKDKLFTLYGRFHLHIEGKGLGLYLAKAQISALGGKIEVESNVNVGTTFKVFLKL
ncbi:MAG TPA: HAMP domain-containing sensor histidine kinase [Cyclobacteriaceae bacterium]